MESTRKGILALVLLAWVFASMAVFARYLGLGFELFTQAYLRIALAFVISLILFAPKIRFNVVRAISKRDLAIIFIRAVFLYTGVVLFIEAVLHTKIGNASLIATLPLMPIFGYVLLKEKVSLRAILWIFVGFAGSLLIAFKDLSISSLGYGELMALLSLVAFDVSYVTRRWQSDKINNFETTCLMFALGAVLLFISAMIVGESLPAADSFTGFMIFILVVSGVFNVANLYLTNYGFEHVKVAVAGNILVLEVVFALAYGFLLFSEVPSLKEVIGGLLIIVSVYFVNKLEQ